MEEINIFELFAGIGAPRKAFENLGIAYKSLGFSEIDEKTSEAYRNIFDDFKTQNFGDIKKINFFPQNIDILFGGFPCQDISRAGAGKGIIKDETRSGLMFDMVSFIEKTNPKCVLTENVEDFLSKKHKKQFDLYIDFLENLEYKVSFNVLNSKFFNVPQNRKRVFIIANKEKKINLEFENLKEAENLIDFIDFTSFEKQICEIPQATKNGYINLTTPAVANLAFPNSKTRRGRVISDGKIIPTLQTSHEFYAFQSLDKKIEKRKINAKECLKIMGFSEEDYHKISNFSESQIIKMAGNSIVVPVLEKILKRVLVDKLE